MRPGSPELIAALQAGERVYDAQIRLGGVDVTDEVSSWSVDRGSDTGLPEQVATPTGSTAAEAKITLDGSGVRTAASRYSPWAPRATADIARPGQSCVLEWGLAEQRLQALRGRVRTVDASSRTGQAHITALDGAELLRGTAWMPPAYTSSSYIHAQWVVDHALRMSGIYTSPPPRQGSIFYASMNGSLEANLGMRTGLTALVGYSPARSPWTAGPAVSGSGANEYATWSATYAPAKRVLCQQQQLMVEWWIYRRSTTDNPRSEVSLVVADRPFSDSGARQQTTITVSYDPSVRQLHASVAAATTGTSTWTVPAGADQAGRFKVAFLLSFTSTSEPVVVRGWLYQPDGTLYTSGLWGSPPPTWGVLESVGVVATGPMECVGVAEVTGTVPVVQTWQRGAVLDLIHPTGGASSSNNRFALSVLPEVSGSWWDLLKQIAADNLAYMWFTEDGLFRMRPYDYVTPDINLPPEPDTTITAARELADVTVAEEIDGVRNRIEVGYTSYGQYSASGTMYDVTGVIALAAGASSDPVRYDFGRRPWLLRPPMIFGSTTIPPGDYQSLVKWVTAAGSRAPVEIEIRWETGYAEIIFHNRGVSTAYSAVSSASLSTSSLRLAHATTTSSTPLPVGRQNLDSIARFGVQTLEVGTSPWVQSVWWADGLALALVAWTAWPVPMTGALDILPDPRLQIGDVVRVVDRQGTRIDGMYRILGYTVRGTSAGVRMTVSLRPLSRPAPPEDVGLSPEPVLDPAAAESFPG